MEWKFLSLGDKIRKTKSSRESLEAIADKKLREMEEEYISKKRPLRFQTSPSALKKLADLEGAYLQRVLSVKARLAHELLEKDTQLTSYYIDVCKLVKECNATSWPRCDFIGRVIEEVPPALFATFTI